MKKDYHINLLKNQMGQRDKLIGRHARVLKSKNIQVKLMRDQKYLSVQQIEEIQKIAFPQIMNYQFNSKQRRLKESEIYLNQKNKVQKKLPVIKQQPYQELFINQNKNSSQRNRRKMYEQKPYFNPQNFKNQNKNPNNLDYNKRNNHHWQSVDTIHKRLDFSKKKSTKKKTKGKVNKFLAGINQFEAYGEENELNSYRNLQVKKYTHDVTPNKKRFQQNYKYRDKKPLNTKNFQNNLEKQRMRLRAKNMF